MLRLSPTAAGVLLIAAASLSALPPRAQAPSPPVATELSLALVAAEEPGPLGTGSGQDEALSMPKRTTPASLGKWELIQITTKDKLRISASYYPPKASKGRRAPAALLVHSAEGKRSDVAAMAASLQKRGFAVLAIDLRGHGDSTACGTEWDKMDADKKALTWSYALRDLDAGVKYLRSRSEVHTSNLSVVGVMSGSTLAARYAKKHEEVRALALVAPQPKEYGFDVTDDLAELSGLPTLIIASKDGRKVADAMAEAAHKANPEEGDYVTVQVLKSERAKILDDTKFKSRLGTWLKESADPKKDR